MAVNISAKTLEVFKFKETGVVALCQEVADFISTEDYYVDRIDLSSARYVFDGDCHTIVFDWKNDD